ncbi:MAG: FTR1 family protein [Elusimicrobia bacterium]|nr:FTR1 family protein [Elusimicrobiota bacterium]
MFQSFVITLREGLEAFLIVAISLAYLRKRGQNRLVPAVRWGIGISVLLSVVAGVLLGKASNQPLWEGILALVAVVLVGSLVVHMWRAAKTLRKDIEHQLAASATQAGKAAFWGVFFFTALMITREGMEMALLMNTLLFQVSSVEACWGALLGLVLAAGLAWMWSRYGHRIQLGLFLQVTSVFLVLFLFQLFIYGFHELTEAAVLPLDNEKWHWITEPYGPDGVYGQWLSFALVLIPVGWLLVAWVRERRQLATS